MKKASAGAYRQQPQNLRKVAKFKGGYSSDASLVFQSWLKDIWVYTIERRLSQWEAIQLVKDYTSKQARSEAEYYLGPVTSSGVGIPSLTVISFNINSNTSLCSGRSYMYQIVPLLLALFACMYEL